MSPAGVPAAFIFIGSVILFVCLMIALDFWLEQRNGDQGTITYGVRYLIAHVPLLMLSLAFLLGCLVGGLLMHFAGAPTLFWP